ncbi:MAG: T9SS type A sorting domain-containing protein [Candidatus Kapabacteria bacterium]|nr:T9SS type A sorting domain-containing protein [Candidatus Kapabacteria bacterium]
MKITTILLLFFIQITSVFAQPGQGWTAINTGNSDSYLDVHIVSQNEAWIVGTGGVVLKSNGYIDLFNKENITDLDSSYIFRSFLSLGGDKRIIAGGTNIAVNIVGGNVVNPNRVSAFLSNDAGGNWTAFNGTGVTSTNRWMSDLARRGATQIWAPGYFYNPTQKVYLCRILYSPDLGTNWIQHPTIIDKKMNKMVFLTDEVGLICADAGTVIRTVNGGGAWTQVSTMTNQELTDIVKINETTAIAVGRNGTIVKTVNGGETWNSLLSNTTKHLFSVDFVNSNEGYIAGQSGTLLYTQDGGNTWTSNNLPTTQDLNAITVTKSENDSYAAIVVGNNGTAFWTQIAKVSVAETNQNDVEVYPNPVEKVLHLNITSNENFTVSILSHLGTEMLSTANQTSINVSSLPSGTYYVQISTPKGIQRSRFVKM